MQVLKMDLLAVLRSVIDFTQLLNTAATTVMTSTTTTSSITNAIIDFSLPRQFSTVTPGLAPKSECLRVVDAECPSRCQTISSIKSLNCSETDRTITLKKMMSQMG